ncbi:MAG TPA: PhoU domain-containing protein, partial [Candidatus Limnocylindria bacterium]
MTDPEHGAADSHGAPDSHGAIRTGFDESLSRVKDDVLRLGALVEEALERAGRAMQERDVDLADQVRWDDANVNDLQRRVNQEITAILATQQPMARDLRELLALYHASAELERMGDYAVNISKLAQQM